jgi:hypothetical protein
MKIFLHSFPMPIGFHRSGQANPTQFLFIYFSYPMNQRRPETAMISQSTGDHLSRTHPTRESRFRHDSKDEVRRAAPWLWLGRAMGGLRGRLGTRRWSSAAMGSLRSFFTSQKETQRSRPRSRQPIAHPRSVAQLEAFFLYCFLVVHLVLGYILICGRYLF